MKLQEYHQDSSEATGVGIQVTTVPATIYSITIGPHGNVDLFNWAGPGDPPVTVPYRLMTFGTPADRTVTFEFERGLPVEQGIFVAHHGGGVLIVYET